MNYIKVYARYFLCIQSISSSISSSKPIESFAVLIMDLRRLLSLVSAVPTQNPSNFSVTGRKRNKHSAAYFNFAFKFFRDKIIKRFINLLGLIIHNNFCYHYYSLSSVSSSTTSISSGCTSSLLFRERIAATFFVLPSLCTLDSL